MKKMKFNSVGFALPGAIKTGEKLILGGLVMAAIGLFIIKKGQNWFVASDSISLTNINEVYNSLDKHCRP